jgi:hypothetical protein
MDAHSPKTKRRRKKEAESRYSDLFLVAAAQPPPIISTTISGRHSCIYDEIIARLSICLLLPFFIYRD